MILKSENKVYGMHKKSRVDLGCPVINVDSESLVCGMNSKREH